MFSTLQHYFTKFKFEDVDKSYGCMLVRMLQLPRP